MERVGIQYFCTDEENLFHSLKRDPAYVGTQVDHLELFQGWRIKYDGASVNAVFRERPLSDFIGFTAAKNDPQEAARHLLHHMTHIASMVPHSRPSASISGATPEVETVMRRLEIAMPSPSITMRKALATLS